MSSIPEGLKAALADDERDLELLQILFAYPQMHGMKNDPRYGQLLERLGLAGNPTL